MAPSLACACAKPALSMQAEGSSGVVCRPLRMRSDQAGTVSDDAPEGERIERLLKSSLRRFQLWRMRVAMYAWEEDAWIRHDRR